MTTLLILVVFAYLLIGIVEVIGICAIYMFEPDEGPSLWECVVIMFAWGYFEYKAWRKRNGR